MALKPDFDDIVRMMRDSTSSEPVHVYVRWLFQSMHEGSESLRVLYESQALPVPPDWPPADLPSFEKVRNRIKVLAGLDPVRYFEPQVGHVELSTIDPPLDLDVRVTCYDMDASPRVELLMTSSPRAPEERPVPGPPPPFWISWLRRLLGWKSGDKT